MSILVSEEGNVQDYLENLISKAIRICEKWRNFRDLTLREKLGRRI